MPLVELIRINDEFVPYRFGVGEAISAGFIAGETMPIYEPNISLDAATKNIGNLPSIARTEYSGTVAAGVTQLNSVSTISNTNFTNTVVDIRANTTFNNCRFTLTDYTLTDTIGGLVRALNGGSLNNIVFNDCEFHVRAQRIMNAFAGRNATFNRCVFTGGVDGLSLSASGSAAQSYGLIINDSWVGDHGWWRYSTTGVVHGSDYQTHNDGVQVSVANLNVAIDNTFFGTWPSEFVGTGTPGAGSETNTFSATYIVSQSTQNSWRATYLNSYSRADQSFGGVQRRSSTTGMGEGSWAGVMINRPTATINHCWFSGGTVHINAVDTNMSGMFIGTFTRNHHWNDMTAGHDITSTNKGTAMYVLNGSGTTSTIPTTGSTKNIWFDTSTTNPSYTT